MAGSPDLLWSFLQAILVTPLVSLAVYGTADNFNLAG